MRNLGWGISVLGFILAFLTGPVGGLILVVGLVCVGIAAAALWGADSATEAEDRIKRDRR